MHDMYYTLEWFHHFAVVSSKFSEGPCLLLKDFGDGLNRIAVFELPSKRGDRSISCLSALHSYARQPRRGTEAWSQVVHSYHTSGKVTLLFRTLSFYSTTFTFNSRTFRYLWNFYFSLQTIITFWDQFDFFEISYDFSKLIVTLLLVDL